MILGTLLVLTAAFGIGFVCGVWYMIGGETHERR